MIILDTTTRSLQAKLPGAVTTNQLICVAAWVDHTTTAYTPGSTNILTNNGTAVTLVAAPAASTQRSIKYLTIQNADTVSQIVTIIYNDNATLRNLLVVTLAVNDTLQYIDTEGFCVIDASGQKKTIASLGASSAVIGHVISDTGSVVVASAGTNLNTSLLALEAGGNLASIKAKTDNIPAQGQALAAASLPVVLTAAQITTLTPPAAITGFATETTLAAEAVLVGAVTETAPGTDTASSGLNGRLQRIAQRLTSLIALLPAALVGGRLDVNVGASTTIAVTESGTWTVQPGNTPNTTPWLVGHGKTLKTVSGALTADTDVIAAVTSKRIKVTAFSLTGVGVNANLILFKSNGTGGTELWRVLMQSSTAIAAGANLATPAPSFLFATVAGEKLTMDVNQTDSVNYSITYFDDDAT